MYKWEIYHLLTETEKKLEALQEAMNTPNTGDQYVVNKVISILNLAMDSQKGWVRRDKE